MSIRENSLFSLGKRKVTILKYTKALCSSKQDLSLKKKKKNYFPRGLGWLNVLGVQLSISVQVMISAQVRLCADSVEPACDPLSSSLSAPPQLMCTHTHTHSLSKYINKH